MKRILAVLVFFLLPLSAMSETGGDSGSNSGATAAERKMAGPQRAVRAIYWKSGYIILTADAKTEFGGKKKSAIKPIAKK